MTPAAEPGHPATLRDVADLAGVNPATASRALNAATRQMVTDETAERVARAAAALGYVPDHAGVSLRTRSSRTAGVLVPDQGDPGWASFVRGVEDRLAAAGYLALCRSTDSDTQREQDILTQMRGRHVEGLIVAGRDSGSRIAEATAGLPVVAAGYRPDTDTVPWVAADVAVGAALLAGHLTSLGHQAIGCVAAPGTGPVATDFAAALRAAGLATPLVVVARVVSAAEGLQCCAILLDRRPSCTAIVTTHDALAAGCQQALAAAGRECPRDVSVAGFGDLPFAGCLTPALTTIGAAQYTMGERAAQMLVDQICGAVDGSLPPQLVRPELTVRASTGPAPDLPLAVPSELIPAGG